mmetsp:Transcript_7328/g.16059  ORF Transcript_7328/g.16059 Transcript_7328/m.16059 type:complete len:162 (+) Transcript_7328:89-574(+)|eukprot:CAMPEP_0183757298 /NCGR_PEP_ID=MMETSP0739-20130205/5651_1 /TAXON_ID=385413 /ORGANISM="Thalassiosira miniscula, Strain CCMP1093" /LENGTH=161 /DNA_ID=CAMNT_0025994709 /DNA_START=42 /DNA_END=527 /DNA_ORIENTATION=-
MRSALKQLCRHGLEALRPQKFNDRWRKPVVSKRVAADLRKLAIRNGTYGKFDTTTGVGWDPAWDAPERKTKLNELEHPNNAETMDIDNMLLMGSNRGGIQSIRPPKETKRQRTRESRAQKIEDLLAQADEKIEQFRSEEEAKKPKPGIEEEFKRAQKSSSW